jgi:hypothetical protein
LSVYPSEVTGGMTMTALGRKKDGEAGSRVRTSCAIRQVVQFSDARNARPISLQCRTRSLAA